MIRQGTLKKDMKLPTVKVAGIAATVTLSTRTSVRLFACLAMVSGSIGTALGAGGHCPSAPQPYDTSACNNFCVRDPIDPTLMRCDLSLQPGNNDVVVVKNYRAFQIVGQTTYSAWGTADGVDFCCTVTSTQANPLNSVEVLTGAGDDEIWFTAFDANGNRRNLNSNPHQTASPWFIGFVYPGAGRDHVQGSNSRKNDYLDFLTGEDGADTIYGNKGADFISVAATRTPGVESTGNGGEAVYGGNGRDEIVGATNDIVATDVIFVDGGNQNDLLCTGPVNWLTAQTVFFFGGAGDDQIYSRSSFVAGQAGAIDGGAGFDGCDNPGGSAMTACEAAYNNAAFTAWSPLGCF